MRDGPGGKRWSRKRELKAVNSAHKGQGGGSASQTQRLLRATRGISLVENNRRLSARVEQTLKNGKEKVARSGVTFSLPLSHVLIPQQLLANRVNCGLSCNLTDIRGQITRSLKTHSGVISTPATYPGPGLGMHIAIR